MQTARARQPTGPPSGEGGGGGGGVGEADFDAHRKRVEGRRKDVALLLKRVASVEAALLDAMSPRREYCSSKERTKDDLSPRDGRVRNCRSKAQGESRLRARLILVLQDSNQSVRSQPKLKTESEVQPASTNKYRCLSLQCTHVSLFSSYFLEKVSCTFSRKLRN